MIKRQKYLWVEVAIVTILLLLLLALAPLGWGIDWPIEFWIKQVVFALILTVAYFANALYLVPALLLKNKLWQYGFALLLAIVFVSIFIQFVEYGLNLPRLMHEIFRPNTPYKPRAFWFRFDFPGFLMTLLAFGASTIVALVRKSQQDALLRQELEKQQVATELSLLKAQINPHFFFNTLNNIYALASLDVESAKKAIHMLSAMMRYVLYDARKEFTLVSQEIKFIDNYIELMKLRLPNKVTVTYQKPETFKQELIAPMMMLPYVENAFKHGVSSQTPTEIKIRIGHDTNRLTLYVENTIFKSNALNMEGSGIGMVNTRRRLELLYPGKYEVKTEEKNGQYIINFSIDLS